MVRARPDCDLNCPTNAEQWSCIHNISIQQVYGLLSLVYGFDKLVEDGKCGGESSTVKMSIMVMFIVLCCVSYRFNMLNTCGLFCVDENDF